MAGAFIILLVKRWAEGEPQTIFTGTVTQLEEC